MCPAFVLEIKRDNFKELREKFERTIIDPSVKELVETDESESESHLLLKEIN